MESSRFQFSFFLLLFIFFSISSSCSSSSVTAGNNNGGRTKKIVTAVAEAGYYGSARNLEISLTTLITLEYKKTTGITIFCPTDQAFQHLKYYSESPPFTILQYHAVPFKLDKDAMLASFSVGSKIRTLLPGHPLVVTALPDEEIKASINNVTILDWHIYDDGDVIVHGVEGFFDPAFQTFLYRDYEKNINNNNYNEVNDEKNRSRGVNSSDNNASGRKYEFDEDLIYVVAVVVIVSLFLRYFVLRNFFRYLRRLTHAYIQIDSNSDIFAL